MTPPPEGKVYWKSFRGLILRASLPQRLLHHTVPSILTNTHCPRLSSRYLGNYQTKYIDLVCTTTTSVLDLARVAPIYQLIILVLCKIHQNISHKSLFLLIKEISILSLHPQRLPARGRFAIVKNAVNHDHSIFSHLTLQTHVHIHLYMADSQVN